MKVLPSSYFRKKYKKLVRKNPQLSDIIDLKLENLKNNPNHPSLRMHKLIGDKSELWSISVSKRTRIIFQYIDDGILLVNIGSHDEVY